MTNIKIFQKEERQMTNSKNVADVFNKDHRHVLRDIKKLDCSDEFRESNFGLSEYTSEQNKILPCVDMTKDGFTFLCMGYRGEKAAKFKEAYIAEFNRMANVLNNLSDRVNKLEREGAVIKGAGREWSKIGHEIRNAKKDHKLKTVEIMNEIQIRLDI